MGCFLDEFPLCLSSRDDPRDLENGGGGGSFLLRLRGIFVICLQRDSDIIRLVFRRYKPSGVTIFN